ncbi:HMA2 domain-containing protein [Sulfurospirillum barnesii]|uniref:Cation transporter n=1 Tax=Sulfurospirillum barnesii (strain ATCC 700032 / DSM 10660 / SES-3) TaxID=760154 RepID=I3XY67_SULBS|nr:hypothetical protein [Sulfurospirillum barnesii]AFL68891.1 hypothetical protein Sulba_1603 [Sulfurospirillum barnesii SES-3]
MDITAEKLVELGRYFSIIHHIKGRIRLRVNPKIKCHGESVSLQDIEALPQKIEGIKSIKINKIVGSLTIEYDAHIFPDHLWKDLVHGENLEELVSMITRLSKEFI